jgi:hypothetical protein
MNISLSIRNIRSMLWLPLAALMLAAGALLLPQTANAQTIVTLGDFVWNDLDQDGAIDAGEPGVANVTVNVYDATDTLIDSDITSATGAYTLNVPGAGTYRIQIDGSEFLPSGDLYGFLASPLGSDSVGDASTNDVTVVVVDGEVNNDQDFGFYAAGKSNLGNYVWLDSDYNGDHDVPAEGEFDAGIDDVLLNIYRDRDGNGIFDPAVDTLWSTAVTGEDATNPGSSGWYNVPVIGNEIYFVQVDPSNFDPGNPLEGLVFTNNNGTAYPIDDTNNDGNTTPPTDDPALVLLSTDPTNNFDVDFGFAPAMSLGSYIWEDANLDGAQDAGESPIQDALVELFVDDGTGNFIAAVDTAGDPVLSQTTLADGLYFFDNLPEGTYRIQVTPPDGYSYVAGAQDGAADNDEENDSNIASESAGVFTSATIDLAAGAEPTETGTFAGDGQDDAGVESNGNMTLDMGFVQPVSLGSFIWEDDDRDGVQDAGEAGINGATVALLVEDPANPGTFIAATDIDGNAVPDATTLADGLYFFDNLPAGVYKVQVTPPAGYGYVATAQDPNADNDEADDSNIASESGGVFESAEITLSPGAEPTETGGFAGDAQDDTPEDTNGNMTLDLGLTPVVSLGSFIWDDTNDDGVQDAGEPGIAGATVALLVDDGTGTFIPATDIDGNAVPDVTTLADGLYYFDNLPEGTYKVEVTPPAGYAASPVQNDTDDDDTADDSNIASESGGVFTSTALTLSAGGEPTEAGGLPGDDQDDTVEANGNMTLDIAFVGVVSLGSFIWEDLNGDGVQDVGEPGIEGATVALLVEDANNPGTFIPAEDIDGNPVADQTTLADGLYFFDNLPEGDYRIVVTPPTGYLAGPVQNDTDDDDTADDSNIAIQGAGVFTSTVLTLSGGGEPTEAGSLPGDDQDDTVEANGNMTLDLAFVPVPTLAVEKILNTPEPVRAGDAISFTIRITNTGTTVITVLPLEDAYDTNYLVYTEATPNSDDNLNDGTINWADLTVASPSGFGSDLAAGASVDVVVNFTGLRDTTALPDESTINTATVSGAEDENGNTPDDATDDEPVSIFAPTGVFFADRGSLRSGAVVHLRWSTLDESQLAAFRVVRTNSDGTEVVLTADAIVAAFAGQAQGNAYAFTDADLAGQSTVHYDLEVISLDGTVTRLDLGRVHAGATSYLPLVTR